MTSLFDSLQHMGMSAERVTDVLTVHGEGPHWTARPSPPFDEPGHGTSGLLRFVDMAAGALLSFDPTTGRTTRSTVGPFAACVRSRQRGGLVMALRRSFALLDPGADSFRPLDDLWADDDVRFNEGGCDPAGRFFCGSTHDAGHEGRGDVFRLDPDGDVTLVLRGVTVSNGLAFSPDGRTAYYTDTPTGRIDLVDIDPVDGTWGAARPFIVFEPDDGLPDGLCLDAEGGVWVAMWEGSGVRRYDSAGRLDAVVDLPATYPTCPAFGGPDLTDLYVTTSRRDVKPGTEPEAGALFLIQPGIAGAPVPSFAG
jgi:sugar lactone lactonase YvrE